MQVLTVDFKLLENELRVLINPAPALLLHTVQVSANAVTFAKLAASRPPLPAPHPWGQCSYHLPLLATSLLTRAELASLLVSVSWHAVAMLLSASCPQAKLCTRVWLEKRFGSVMKSSATQGWQKTTQALRTASWNFSLSPRVLLPSHWWSQIAPASWTTQAFWDTGSWNSANEATWTGNLRKQRLQGEGASAVWFHGLGYCCCSDRSVIARPPGSKKLVVFFSVFFSLTL